MCRRLFLSGIAVAAMFWNLECFFDPFDDPATMDEEFTPRGRKHWTWKQFQSKRDGIAKTTESQFSGIPLAYWGMFLYLFITFLLFVDKLKNL